MSNCVVSRVAINTYEETVAFISSTDVVLTNQTKLCHIPEDLNFNQENTMDDKLGCKRKHSWDGRAERTHNYDNWHLNTFISWRGHNLSGGSKMKNCMKWLFKLIILYGWLFCHFRAKDSTGPDGWVLISGRTKRFFPSPQCPD
jgi:hypothetical protein